MCALPKHILDANIVFWCDFPADRPDPTFLQFTRVLRSETHRNYLPPSAAGYRVEVLSEPVFNLLVAQDFSTFEAALAFVRVEVHARM
jgi:hypothetical protein